jgi:3-hydroxybutyrate dehydrogenase
MGALRYDFTGECVLVTGASHGIGFAVARAFVRAGAEVTVLSSGAGIRDAAAEIGARALECDITDAGAVKAALAGMGRIDVLVNNAGLERITPVDGPEGVEDTFRRITDINVNGTFHVTRHALPKMPAGGRIIVTASIWSRVAVPEFSAYVTSKHANLGFMR